MVDNSKSYTLIYDFLSNIPKTCFIEYYVREAEAGLIECKLS